MCYAYFCTLNALYAYFRVMDGWSVIQQTMVYKGRLLKTSSNRKSKLTPFRHSISFATDLAAIFGCY